MKTLKKQDLKKEGRYLDILHKYGGSEYYRILKKAMYNEIKENKGIIPAIIWRAKEYLLSVLEILGTSTALLLPIISTDFAVEVSQLIDDNSVKYESEISLYDKKINDYAKEIQDMKLEDIQIFMKVMDDMWGSIKGYGEPKKDIIGFLELDLATEDGVGVCRNMASDISKKLNAINPKYNARIMNIYIDESGEYQIADIERNIIETNDTIIEDSDEENKISDKLIGNIAKITGNHMVTLVDIPNEKLTLVLDPTNPGIGVYKNGKIVMLNSNSENEKKYSAKEFGTVILVNGIDSAKSVAEGYINSFQSTELTMEQIQKKYGIEAQNEALLQVRKMNTRDNEFDTIIKEGVTFGMINRIESGELANQVESQKQEPKLEIDEEDRSK